MENASLTVPNAWYEFTKVSRLEGSTSLNNRVILEKYIKQGLRSDESRNTGFAMIAQKIQLKGLKVLVDSLLSDGTLIKAGSVAYIKEEVLHTAPWAAKIWECDGIEGQFIIADISQVEFVKP